MYWESRNWRIFKSNLIIPCLLIKSRESATETILAKPSLVKGEKFGEVVYGYTDRPAVTQWCGKPA